jgi:hypothetical protein
LERFTPASGRETLVTIGPTDEQQERARQLSLDARKNVPGVVFACLLPGELKVVLYPGYGIAAGPLHDIPVSVVPHHLRMPNTKLWIEFDAQWKPVKVWSRIELVGPDPGY